MRVGGLAVGGIPLLLSLRGAPAAPHGAELVGSGVRGDRGLRRAPQSLGDSSPRPKKWAYDDERRRVAGVPEDVEFRTKPELAAEMVHQAAREGLAIRWVTADAVYGGNFAFRQGLIDICNWRCWDISY